MNLADIQNAIIARQRQFGVAWGSSPTNSNNSFLAPYEILLYINQAYNDFLSRTMNNQIAAIQIQFNSIENSMSVPLNSCPASGAIINPAALRVHEFIYTQQNSYDRRVEILSTEQFRTATGQYQQRFNIKSNYPQFATQLFGRRQLDVFPALANSTDVIKLTITPDPCSSPVTCLASNGGQLVNGTDIPLFPAQFHSAIVHYVVSELSDISNKPEQRDNAFKRYLEIVDNANAFGSTYGEGSSEISIQPYW